MGSLNCCSNRSVSYSSKIIEEYVNEDIPDNKTKTKSRNFCEKSNMGLKKTFTKKNSFFFDKSNFINMKTNNLLDDYEIREKLGEGAYGCVYKAYNKKGKIIRAVKAIKRQHINNTSFSNEIQILKTVDHPNIIKLFEFFNDNNYFYMVEEYCSGGDLYDYIKRQKNFSEKKAAYILAQILSAINYLHSRKIVHRDLKPENIVFVETASKEIFIKIIDFGTSIYLKNEPLTQELGTIYYIAPEVFRNNYNEKADIWSCGIILYTMLCGHPPFRGKKEEEIKNKILKGKLEFTPREWSIVSNEAISFINELLSYDTSKRPSAQCALKNPWLIKMLQSEESEDNILGDCIAINLIKFHSAVILQKASLSFIANQFGQNEDIKRLKHEFDKIDTNKDGVLSREELIECLSKIYPIGEAQEKVDEFINLIDFNNDGTINFSEFVTVTIEKTRLLSEEMLKKAFYMFDIVSDGNGFITIDELRQTILLDIKNSDETWCEIIEEVDIDGDGQISFEEFKIMMSKFGNKV